MKDRLGLAFFTFAAVVSALAAWEHPTDPGLAGCVA